MTVKPTSRPSPRPIPRRQRPQAPGPRRDTTPTEAGADVAAMIRVDHAGEYGAVRIYEGQLAVMRARGGTGPAVKVIEHMAEQEQQHLNAFNTLINDRRVRPTALAPLWHMAGFALGAASAMLGEKSAMACTAAVEEVIDGHYAKQVAALDHDPALKKTIAEFRADEIAHRKEALSHGAESAPAYRLFSSAVKAGCHLAIRLSERL